MHIPASLCAVTLLTACSAPPAQKASALPPAAQTMAAHPTFAPMAPALPTATWTAVSTASMGVTGDIQTAPDRLILRGHPYQLQFKRDYMGKDLQNAARMLSTTLKPESHAALYGVDIPGTVKLANGNTFCGRSATTYVVILQTGAELDVANFSGDAVPDLDPAVLNNSTALCGTLGYQKK